MIAEWWVSVDFDSQSEILWGETKAHEVPTYCIHEISKLKNKNLHNYSHPLSYQTGACWGGGGVLYIACTSDQSSV